MATSTKVKARPSKAKSATRKNSKSKGGASSNRPKEDDPGYYFPKVGEIVGVCINDAPFWEPCRWGLFALVNVTSIRDVYKDPLTLDEFAEVATQNIGRWLIEATDDVTKEEYRFFWNDCNLTCYHDSHDDFIELKDDAPEQPYRQYDLRIVVEVVAALVDTAFSSGSTIGERLLLIAKMAELRFATEDELSNYVRVRPIVTA